MAAWLPGAYDTNLTATWAYEITVIARLMPTAMSLPLFFPVILPLTRVRVINMYRQAGCFLCRAEVKIIQFFVYRVGLANIFSIIIHRTAFFGEKFGEKEIIFVFLAAKT